MFHIYIRFNTLTDHSGLQVHEHGPWNVFSGSSLTEERVEGVVTSSDCLVAWHLSIRLNTVLQTVQLPATVADLDPGLANVNTDTLSLKVTNDLFIIP